MNIDEYVIVNKKFMGIVGLYPINLLRYFISISLIFLILVPQMFQYYLSRNDLSAILETSSVSLTLLVSITKSVVWVSNSETPRIINFLMTDYWQIARSIDMDNRMHEHAKSGKNVTQGFSFLIANSLLIFYSFQPFNFILKKLRGNYGESSSEETNFPFPAAYPNFCYQSPFYELTYVSQLLATTSCALLVLAMDPLIATSLFHTCGHLEILHNNLLGLNDYIDDQVKYSGKDEFRKSSKYSNEVNRSIEKRLSNLVTHHQVIIRFSDSVEKAFNLILFLQVFGSSLILCLVGFQLASTTAKSYKLAEYFSYLLMAMFQILLFCWPGDKVIYHSLNVATAAFFVKWYDSSNSIKTGIRFIILRSQKPNCLTAGKFYKMCMTSFVSILNTSFSYFMLLRSINTN